MFPALKTFGPSVYAEATAAAAASSAASGAAGAAAAAAVGLLEPGAQARQSAGYRDHLPVGDKLPYMVYLYDISGRRFLFIDGGIETLLGYVPDEIIAMGKDALTLLLPAPDRARALQTQRTLSAAIPATGDYHRGEVIESEYCFVQANGSLRALSCRERPYERHPETGEVQLIIGIAREAEQPAAAHGSVAEAHGSEADKDSEAVSPETPLNDAVALALSEAQAARKVAEASRQTAEAARQAAEIARRDAEDSERKLRLALEAASMVAWEWDCGAVSDPLGSEMMRIPVTGQGAIFSQVGDFLFHVHPDDREAVRASLRHALSTPLQPEFMAEYRLRLPDETGIGGGAPPETEHSPNPYRWNAARGYAVHDDATGRPLRFSGVRWDIEETKKTESRLAAEAQKQAHIAETLQRSLLPPLPPHRFPSVELYTRYEAALDEARLGGDFFDALSLGDGRIALVVGDVSGKGLVSATRTAEVKFRLRALLCEFPSPTDALARLNRQLYEERRLETDPSEREGFVALCAAVLDTRTGSLSLAVAGIEPPLIVRAAAAATLPRRAEMFSSGGLPLGMLPDWQQNSSTGISSSGIRSSGITHGEPLPLLPGDVLMLYTDGLAEATRADGKDIFGTSRLLRALSRALASPLPPAAPVAAIPPLHLVGEKLFAEVGAFTGDVPAQDDTCLLLVRFCAVPAPA